MLNHFKELKKSSAGMGTITAEKLRIFCELEWPAFKVRWPSEGSFDKGTMELVFAVIFGEPGNPDQEAYIYAWQSLVSQPPD